MTFIKTYTCNVESSCYPKEHLHLQEPALNGAKLLQTERKIPKMSWAWAWQGSWHEVSQPASRSSFEGLRDNFILEDQNAIPILNQTELPLRRHCRRYQDLHAQSVSEECVEKRTSVRQQEGTYVDLFWWLLLKLILIVIPKSTWSRSNIPDSISWLGC